MRVHRRWRLLAAFVPVFAVASAALAQVTVEVGPSVGVYAPVGTYRMLVGVSTAFPTTPSDQHLGRRLTASLGVTTLLYSLDVKDAFGRTMERGFQTDLLAHVALA